MCIYVIQESDILGVEVIGFIQFFELVKMLDLIQCEIVIECVLVVGEVLIILEKFKVIVLMVLWSQGKELDGLMFEELFFDEDDIELCLLY